tara:strand:+ start:90 stop:695 length:606 start_codon:yes stop_codon:yes gene_type:complete
MIKMEPFDCYKEYVAIKTHFHAEKYDYFKHRKRKVSYETFKKRNDQFFFVRLSKNYKDDEIAKFFVANFIDDENLWIGEALDPQAELRYKDWQKRIQALTYFFNEDIEKLLEKDEFENWFKVVGNEHPMLLKLAIAKYISIETFSILNLLTNFIPDWDKKIKEKFVWPQYRSKVLKYSPFLEVDKKKFRKLLRDKIKQNTT